MVTAESILKKVISNFEGVRSYSGRFMYGRQCVGIVTDEISTLEVRIIEQCLNVVVDKLKNEEITILEMPNIMVGITSLLKYSDIRQDNMALDMIMYFVNWSASEWLNIPEEEEVCN